MFSNGLKNETEPPKKNGKNMVRTPTYFTLSQAAKETGKSKSVISKALKDGTMSHIEKDDSGYKIDPAELFRVFSQNPVLERERERLVSQYVGGRE